MSIVKMDMFYWMYDNTGRYKVINENILANICVVPRREDARKLPIFSHVRCRLIDTPIR